MAARGIKKRSQKKMANKKETKTHFNYNRLWKLLIDKDLMKKDLQSNAGVSWATITKMSKGETVSTEVLMKICKYLQCDVGDIMEFIDAEKSEEKTK